MSEQKNQEVLSAEIRALVVERVRARPMLSRVLAEALDVPEQSIEKMMTRNVWDLGLGLKAADALNLSLGVVLSLPSDQTPPGTQVSCPSGERCDTYLACADGGCQRMSSTPVNSTEESADG